MFGRLMQIANNVKKLDQELIFLKIVTQRDVQEFIIDLNAFDQIFKNSINSKGEKLPGYKYDYDESITLTSNDGRSATRTKERGESFSLVDSGLMLQSFEVVVDGGSFSITADTIKTDEGTFRKTDYENLDILGLTDESKNKLIQEILPMVRRQVRADILA